MRRLTALLAIAGLAIVPAACSSGGSGDATAPSTTTRPAGLPPNSKAALVGVLGPRIDGTGLRFTRAGLQSVETLKYSASGRHLALYLEPVGPRSVEQYVDGLVTTAKALVPYAFERWPGLTSLDICQEPPPGVDDRQLPEPVTTVVATRPGSAAVEWTALDLPGLLAATKRTRGNIDVRVNADIEAAASYRAAAAAAG